jgi:hypothetical protein
MNIFKALSQGDGSINETNVTSFLSYVIHESNEFSAPFLILLLDLIDQELPDHHIYDHIEVSGRNIRQRSRDFLGKYTYSAIPEQRLQVDRSIQDLDVLLTIYERNSDNVCCYFLIENKIKKGAFKREQCLEQFELFKLMDEYQEDVPVYSVLISPDYDVFKATYDEVLMRNELSVWFKWEAESGVSFIDLFKELINLETLTEIAPIDGNTKFIIKNFIDFITSDLSSQFKQVNRTVTGAEVISEAGFTRMGERLKLQRFDNNMIRVVDESNEFLNEPVKPILRAINSEYDLGIDLERKPGRSKNTQVLGREVLQGLIDKQSES